jgi:hypothetical protein
MQPMKNGRFLALIFGCGGTGQRAFRTLSADLCIYGFLDNNPTTHGTRVLGVPVFAPNMLPGMEYDRILVASLYWREIHQQLITEFHIPPELIEIVPEDASGVHALLQRLREASRYLVMILDEYQWEWMKLPFEDVRRLAPRNGFAISYHRSAAMLTRPVACSQALPEAQPDEEYRGVRLLPVVLYSVCVELEVATGELDWCDPRHRECLARWYAAARATVDNLSGVLGWRQPCAVLAMQGYFVSAAVARQLAPLLGFRFIALENTVFPRRIICEALSGIAVNRTAAGLAFWRRQDIIKPGDYVGWLDGLLAGLDAAKAQDHASRGGSFSWPARKKRILFLGQCYTDSSVLFGAQDGATAVTILRSLIAYAEKHGAFVMAKLHPKEDGGLNPLMVPYGRLTWRKLAADAELSVRLGQRGRRGVWEIDEDNRFATTTLLRESDVVVTINSQGALEGLAYGKDVLLLGEAFYGHLGVTINLPHHMLLPGALDAVLYQGVSVVNRETVARFLHVYVHEYCVERTPEAFVAAIESRLWPEEAPPSLPPAGAGDVNRLPVEGLSSTPSQHGRPRRSRESRGASSGKSSKSSAKRNRS